MDLLQARAIILGISAVCAVVAVLGTAIIGGVKLMHPRAKVKESVTVVTIVAAFMAVALALSGGLYSPADTVTVVAKGGDTYYSIISEFKEEDETVNIGRSISSSTGAGWHYCDRIFEGEEVTIVLEHDSYLRQVLKEVINK